MKLPFETPIRLDISDLEIYQHMSLARDIQTFIIRRIGDAVQTELTRPWREVLGMEGKAKE